MKRYITRDDIEDVLFKSTQRGWKFILSKFASDKKRTRSAFGDSAFQSSNWWSIPEVRTRWNKLITEDEKVDYELFVIEGILKSRSNLKMLSLGSGVCSHEIKFAESNKFDLITCVDIADNLLERAAKIAKDKGIRCLEFLSQDVETIEWESAVYDIVFFHSSLHHFRNVRSLLGDKVKKTLKADGLIIINEYVGANRMQWPIHQINAINNGLRIIPKLYRKRFKLPFYKSKVYGPGIWRMIIADPSECIESDQIIPTLNTHFEPILFKPFGGNLLMYILKDIAHNFIRKYNHDAKDLIEKLFQMEDKYLTENESDFVFAIYKNK